VIRHAAVVTVIASFLSFPPIARAEQYHYSMTARVRPFLLFWISRSGVGTATVTRQHAADSARYSLLIGTDPERAPRRINRWGYIDEEISGTQAHLVGLMTQSDEESIEQADASLRAQAAGRHPFKAIQATIADGQATSVVATIAAQSDYTFRDVAAALDLARRESSAGKSRVVQLPPGTRPGFLTALADAIHAGSPAPIRYVYHGRMYELRQTRIERTANFRIGAIEYGGAAAADFLVRSLYDGEQARFSIVYGTSGALADVPIKVTYQPRWWMQVELTLDDPANGHQIAGGVER
jgi:hypothetical protein